MSNMNIVKNNNQYHFYNDVEIIDQLNNGVYELDYNLETFQCFLKKTDDYTLPEKIYPIDNDLIKFSTSEFIEENNNMGILLVGNKGQGKSVTAKRIINELNLPVVNINKKINANVNLIEFLSSIKQNYILFIDEFEKYFNNTDKDYHSQNTFLSFMDGTSKISNKILFLLSSNITLNEYLYNRPSRIKYLREYFELDYKIFDMITSDLLENKSFYDDIKNNVSMLNLNVDTLISIIKMCNRLNKPFSEFKDIFNYRLPNITYDVFILDEKNPNKKEYYNTISYLKRPSFDQYDNYIFDFQVQKIIKYTANGMILDARKEDTKTNEFTIIKTLELIQK